MKKQSYCKILTPSDNLSITGSGFKGTNPKKAEQSHHSLTAIGKAKGQDAALVEVKLVFVWLGDMKNLHIAALHPHCEPLSRGTVAQREDLATGNDDKYCYDLFLRADKMPAETLRGGNLWGEVVLLQLPTLPQIPGANGVVQASGPQLGAVVGDVDTAGSICVTLELPVGHTYTQVSRKRQQKVGILYSICR